MFQINSARDVKAVLKFTEGKFSGLKHLAWNSGSLVLNSHVSTILFSSLTGCLFLKYPVDKSPLLLCNLSLSEKKCLCLYLLYS